MKRIIFTHASRLMASLAVQVFLAVCAHGEEVMPAVTVHDAGNQLAESLTEAVKAVSPAAQKGDDKLLRGLISRQYLESGERIRKLLESNGQNPGNFEKKILSDFDFYTVTGVKKLDLFKNTAFVETSVVFKPQFVTNRHKATDGQQQAESVWNDMGGTLFANQWESGGSGQATYYFVRQNDLWKLHCVYFSTQPLTGDQLESAKGLMETLAGPNTF